MCNEILLFHYKQFCYRAHYTKGSRIQGASRVQSAERCYATSGTSSKWTQIHGYIPSTANILFSLPRVHMVSLTYYKKIGTVIKVFNIVNMVWNISELLALTTILLYITFSYQKLMNRLEKSIISYLFILYYFLFTFLKPNCIGLLFLYSILFILFIYF